MLYIRLQLPCFREFVSFKQLLIMLMANDSSLKLLASWFSLVLAAHSPNQPKQLQNVQQWQSNWKLKTKSLDCWCKKVCGVAAETVVMKVFMEASNVTAQESLGSPCLQHRILQNWLCSGYHPQCRNLLKLLLSFGQAKNENCTFHVNKNAKTKPTKLRAAQALFQMAARQSWKDISMFKCNILVLRQTAIFLSTTRRGPTQSPN